MFLYWKTNERRNAHLFHDALHDLSGISNVVGHNVSGEVHLWPVVGGIYHAQHVESGSHVHVVLIRTAAHASKTGLDVELKVALHAELFEHGHARHGVALVLETPRVVRLRLDQELPAVPDLVFVLERHVVEVAEVSHVSENVPLQQALIAVSRVEEDEVFGPEAFGHLQGVLELGAGVGEYVGVWVSGGAVAVARVGEQVASEVEWAHVALTLKIVRHFAHFFLSVPRVIEVVHVRA